LETIMITDHLLAHHPFPVTPATLWQAWNLAPALLIPLSLTMAVYGWGVWVLWQRLGWGRGVRHWQIGCFLGGWFTLVVALVSPLDGLSETLFAAHMVQHLLLLLLAPLLLVLSRPLTVLVWALPPRLRRQVGAQWPRRGWLRHTWHGLTLPPVVWLLHTALLWIWHTPTLYEAAVVNDWVHLLEHACFFGAAALLWWAVIHPRGGSRRYGIGILILFLTALQGGALGALLTFSPTPWYPIYGLFTRAWGLTPLDDQQLAGLIMWIPPGIFYLGVILALLVAWLAAVERGMERQEPPVRPTVVEERV